MRKTLMILLVSIISLLTIPLHMYAQESTSELKIGCLTMTSGAAAAMGLSFGRGGAMAIEDWNAKGGIKIGETRYKLKYIMEDSKYKSEAGVAAANKLVFTDNIKFVLGPNASVVGAATVKPIFTPNKIITLPISFTSKVLGPDKPYSFRVQLSALEYSSAAYELFAKMHPEIKKVVSIKIDDESGYAAAKDVRKSMEAVGIKTMSDEFFARGTTDFYPLCTRVIAKNPPHVDLFSLTGTDEANIVRQLRELGYTGTLLGMGLTPDVLYEIARKLANGYFMAISFDMGSPKMTEEQKEFSRRYLARYGEPALFESQSGYEGLYILLEAIYKAQTLDTQIVARTLENLTGETPLSKVRISWGGKNRYGIAHQFNCPTYLTVMNAGGSMEVLAKGVANVP
jgi:branched-chain amino acid transport system substrate-binding protein